MNSDEFQYRLAALLNMQLCLGTLSILALHDRAFASLSNCLSPSSQCQSEWARVQVGQAFKEVREGRKNPLDRHSLSSSADLCVVPPPLLCLGEQWFVHIENYKKDRVSQLKSKVQLQTNHTFITETVAFHCGLMYWMWAYFERLPWCFVTKVTIMWSSCNDTWIVFLTTPSFGISCSLLTDFLKDIRRYKWIANGVPCWI